MKRIIQLALSLFLILLGIIFYKTYLTTDDKSIKPLVKSEDQLLLKKEKNNLIKNLKYEVRFDENKQYIITADLSELTYEDAIEIVYMQGVIAVFIDENNIPLTITSDMAVYNNSTYDTNFEKNVRVEYLDHLVISNKLDLVFAENLITIYENVEYKGAEGIIKSDNVKIDLVSKNIEIFMNDQNKKVKVITKK